MRSSSYVLIDDFLPKRPRGRGRSQEISDAEVITLLIAQSLLQIPDDRRFIAARQAAAWPSLPLSARIGARLLALSAALWHNWEIGEPGRHLSAYAY